MFSSKKTDHIGAEPFEGGPEGSKRNVQHSIIGSDVTQDGVINYPCKELGLCASVTNARFTTKTET